MADPLLHFVCGSTGAGKTTYATRLAAMLNGVSFSIDEWMTSLFWMDAPDPIQPVWSLERVDRCSRLILRTATQIARTGSPCVLEVGLTTRRVRQSVAAAAREADLTYQFHFIDVDADERWRRVQARNADLGASAQLGFAVTREMFDFVETMWERPSEEELVEQGGVRVVN